MGRSDIGRAGIGFPRIRGNYIRIAKYAILAGFVFVIVVVLSVFISQA